MTEQIASGRVLGGRYRLIGPIARGGMSTVWSADDPVLSRTVAVKILRADLAEDDALRTRFHNEAISAARLSHPSIVTTYDTGEDDGTAYIVMELVHGPTLRTMLDQTGPMPVSAVVRIGGDVASALDAAHRAGLVHRDVKPGNVIVPMSGPAKVMDFGIAKAVGAADLTRTGTVMGTARYLAPEQVNGRPTDARTDVYALGLLLYEMLAGSPPFGGDTDVATAMARLTTVPAAVRATRPDVPSALDDLVHRCLARHPDARYSSAAAVRDALAAVGRTVRPGPARRPASAAPAPRAAPPAAAVTASDTTRRRSAWPWLVLALLIVAGVAAAVYLLSRDSKTGGGTGDGQALTMTSPVAAQDFDPFGKDGEDHLHVGAAIDGNPSTSWSTEQYDNFRRDKPGVGLILDLGAPRAVHRVDVKAPRAGWSGEIHVSNASGTSFDAWGPAVATGTGLDTDHTFDLANAPRRRYVLLWITALPPDPGGRQSEQIAEVTVG